MWIYRKSQARSEQNSFRLKKNAKKCGKPQAQYEFPQSTKTEKRTRRHYNLLNLRNQTTLATDKISTTVNTPTTDKTSTPATDKTSTTDKTSNTSLERNCSQNKNFNINSKSESKRRDTDNNNKITFTRRIAIALIVLLVSVYFVGCADTNDKKSVLDEQEPKALNYMIEGKQAFDDFSDYSLEMYLFANSKLIKEDKELQTKISKRNIYEKYLSHLDESISENDGKIGANTIKTYATASIALNSLKKNPENYKGNNFVAKLDDAELSQTASITDKAWALIASKYLGIKLQNEETYYNDLINFAQNSSDEEATQIEEHAIVAQALSYYHALPDTSIALSMAMGYIENAQKDNGSFGDGKSTGIVLMSLASLGIDVEAHDPLTKNDKTVKDGLSKFIYDKGFKYKGKDDEISKVTTLYALLGIEAQNRIEKGGLFPKHK